VCPNAESAGVGYFNRLQVSSSSALFCGRYRPGICGGCIFDGSIVRIVIQYVQISLVRRDFGRAPSPNERLRCKAPHRIPVDRQARRFHHSAEAADRLEDFVIGAESEIAP